jgi:hypothetical protein
VHVPASARPESVLIEGHKIPVEGGKKGAPAAGAEPAWLAYSDETLPPGGCEIEMVLGATGALDWYVADSSSGLPPAGAALLAARPSNAVPQHDGDVTIVARRVRI